MCDPQDSDKTLVSTGDLLYAIGWSLDAFKATPEDWTPERIIAKLREVGYDDAAVWIERWLNDPFGSRVDVHALWPPTIVFLAVGRMWDDKAVGDDLVRQLNDYNDAPPAAVTLMRAAAHELMRVRKRLASYEYERWQEGGTHENTSTPKS